MEVRKRTLTIIAAIFLSVAITNSFWLWDHRRDTDEHLEQVCEFVDEANRDLYTITGSLQDSIDILNSEIDSLRQTDVRLGDYIMFVEKTGSTKAVD